MANENDVPINITIETDDAKKTLNGFEKDINKTVNNSEKLFSSLKYAIGAALAVFAGKEIINGIKGIVNEAAEADQTIRTLGVAFAQTGEFSDEAVKSFEDFAAAIQKTTQFSDDAVLQAAALAKNFGITNEQAKQLTATAVNLAAATGKDLNTAVQELGATYSGTAGRLSKLTPELKNLTEEQLKSGVAIDILAKKFEGFAESATQTFSGALVKAQNQFGEISEALGRVITQNPVVIATINALGEVFNDLSDFVAKNKEQLTILLSEGLKAVVSIIPSVVKGFGFMAAALDVINDLTANLIKGFLVFGTAILEISKPLRDLQNILGNALFGAISRFLSNFLRVAEIIPGVSDALAGMGVDLSALQKTVQEFSDNSIEKALTLDTSASDSYQKFAEEAAQSIYEFTDNTQKNINGTLEAIAEGSIGLADYAQEAVDGILKVGNGAKSVTSGIKNLNKEIDKTGDVAKRLEELKGSFDKVKTSVETLQAEVDKQVLSANKLIDAEFERAKQASANAKEELRLQGKATKENLKIIEQFDLLIQKKRQLAREKLTIGDLTISEVFNRIANSVDSVINTIRELSEINFSDFGAIATDLGKSIANGAKAGFEAIARAFADVTLKDLASAFVTGAEVVYKAISGAFLQQGFAGIESFLSIPEALRTIFDNADVIFKNLAESLPTVLGDLFTRLPVIGSSIAESIGSATVSLANGLPDLITGIANALAPIIANLFEEAIPALLRAIPDIIRALARAIPVLVNIILKALPEIILELFKAIPEVIKALVDNIPAIVEAIADNIGPIVLALVQGLIELAPAIIDALITSLLIDGGLERIIKALILAIPRIVIALVQGIVRGVANAALAIGQLIGKGIAAAISNIGKKIGGDVGTGISNGFKSIFGALGSTISSAFTNIFGGLYNAISSAFVNIFGGLYNAIQSAFIGIFGGIGDAIRQGFYSIITGMQTFFGNIGISIANAFQKPIDDLKAFLNNFKFPEIGGKGGGSGVVAETLDRWGFATGGMVPGGFPNDTFPASLTSGELVIPPGDTERLSQFLDMQQKPQAQSSGVTDALLMKILATLQQPQQLNTQVVIGSRELASVILDLQRNNARLSA